MKRIICFKLLLTLIVFSVSCKREVKDDGWHDTMDAGMIRIACDEGFQTLMNAEIDVFEAHFPQATIIPVYVNEVTAIRLLIADSVRFALTSRDLNDKERAELAGKARKARKHLIAFDGIALISNLSNSDSLLSLSVLKKIIAGEVVRWSQLNTVSPLDTIRVLFDNKESGILRYMVDSLSDGTSFSHNLYALNTTLDVIQRVAQMPNALGLISVNALSDDAGAAYRDYRDKIRLIRISKEEIATKENSYLPYAGDIRQENYPLWRSVYVLLSDPRSGLSSGFSVFLANDIGQKVVLKSGLLPVTDPQNIAVNIINAYPQ
jgi:phosphate transport system substrate-binding protein